MPLADIASGTPPAVTHEMLEEWRKIADDVNAALTMGGEQGIEILGSLMAEWCAAVDDVNTAREVCALLAARGLRSEALQWHADGFFEVAEQLTPEDRPGWEEWQAALLSRQMPIPVVDPNLRDAAARIADDMTLLDLSGRSLADWMKDLRLNALLGGRLGDRLTTLEAIRGIDPDGSAWGEMISPIRRQRAGEIAGEVAAAITRSDFAMLESLRRELNSQDWGAVLPASLIADLESAQHWQTLIGGRRAVAEAAARLISQAKTLRTQTTDSVNYDNVLRATIDARTAYLDLWGGVNKNSQIACRVPSIAAKLRDSGELARYKQIDVAAREEFPWIQDQELYSQVREKFSGIEHQILQHIRKAPLEGGEWDAVKASAAAWKRAAAGLRDKAEGMPAKARIGMPVSTQAAIGKLDETRRHIDERLKKIRLWEFVVISILLGIVGLFVVGGVIAVLVAARTK